MSKLIKSAIREWYRHERYLCNVIGGKRSTETERVQGEIALEAHRSRAGRAIKLPNGSFVYVNKARSKERNDRRLQKRIRLLEYQIQDRGNSKHTVRCAIRDYKRLTGKDVYLDHNHVLRHGSQDFAPPPEPKIDFWTRRFTEMLEMILASKNAPDHDQARKRAEKIVWYEREAANKRNQQAAAG